MIHDRDTFLDLKQSLMSSFRGATRHNSLATNNHTALMVQGLLLTIIMMQLQVQLTYNTLIMPNTQLKYSNEERRPLVFLLLQQKTRGRSTKLLFIYLSYAMLRDICALTRQTWMNESTKLSNSNLHDAQCFVFEVRRQQRAGKTLDNKKMVIRFTTTKGCPTYGS